jgi:hypothetical protein
VLSGLELPDPATGDWREQLRASARSFRSVLVSHPGSVPIFLGRRLFTPVSMGAADAMLGLFRQAGFSAEQAVLLYQQVVRFVLALVMLETGNVLRISDEERRERARVARITFETLPADRYPHLVAAAPYLSAPYEPERAFEAGLELLVGGLDHLLATRRPAVTGERG